MVTERREAAPGLAALLSCWATAAAIMGCGASNSETRRRLDALEQQVVQAQNRNDRLEERILALETALDPAGPAQPARAPTGAAPAGKELPVVTLRPEEHGMGSTSAYSEDDAAPAKEPNGEPAGAAADSSPRTLIKIHGPETPNPRGKYPNGGAGPREGASVPKPETRAIMPPSEPRARSAAVNPCAA